MLPRYLLGLFSRNGKSSSNGQPALRRNCQYCLYQLVELGFITEKALREALEVLETITPEQRDLLILVQRQRHGETLKAGDLQKLQELERNKFRQRVSALADGFKEVAVEARGLASSVTQNMNGLSEDTKG